MIAVVAVMFGSSAVAGLGAAALAARRAPSVGAAAREWPFQWTRAFGAVRSVLTGRARVRAGLLLVGWFVAVVVAGWLSGVLSGLGPQPVALPGDQPVLSWFATRRTPALTDVVRAVTWLGDTIVLVSTCVVVGLVWRWRRGSWRALVVGLGAYAGAAVSFNVLKRIIDRPRPDAALALLEPAGSAYPSGHAVDAAAVYLALVIVAAWGLRRAGFAVVAGLAATAVMLVSVSRLYLAVHWLSDVLAGALVGSLWTLGFTTVLAALWADHGSTGSRSVASRSPGSR